MSKISTKFLLPLLLIGNLVNAQSTQVVPDAYASTTAGTTSFAGPYQSTARSYQLLMDTSLLTNLVGNDITGLTFRSAPTVATTWPTSTTTFNNYDVYLGPAVPIPTATNIFATNEAGPQTLVRSGSLVIAPNSFPVGGPSGWGQVTTFNTPYNYTGGNLAVLIRHDGSDGTNRTINALGTSTSGYNTLFKASWLAGYTSIGGSQGNFGIIQFTYNPPLAVNLIRFEANRRNNDVKLTWATASEKNSVRFVIERSSDGNNYEVVHSISITGDSEDIRDYEYTDVEVLTASSVLYYRLRIKDKDGSSKYSNVVKLTNAGIQTGNLAMAPNPVQSVSNISFSLTASTPVTYSVFDMTGKFVFQDKFVGLQGNNSLLTDLSMLPGGLYVLHMNCSEFDDIVKFIKQ